MVQDHTRRLRRAIERHAREHPLGEDHVMSSDADIITALAHKLQAENTRLRAENEALRAGQGHWPEDAPKSEPTVVHDDGGRPWSVEVRPVADPAPRLTVHALNTAPVGSTVQRPEAKPWVKGADGYWRDESPYGVMRVSSEELLDAVWPTATLTYPEEITPEPTPQLTVHQLDTAPVGSTLTGPGSHRMTRTKLEDGRWWAHLGTNIAYGDTSEHMVSQRPDATLTQPRAMRP